jgi:hypothetical protein
MSMRPIAWCIVLALAAARPAAAQEPSLATVLQRAGQYVADFHAQFSGVVAEERYVQEVKAFANRPGQLVNPSRIELRSDLLLVRPASGGEWTEFRDVFEVNGSPVRDRTERLTRLFLDGSPSAREQIGEILDESSRFNIGEIKRNINTPVFALQILQQANQPRFRFRRTRDRVPDTVAQEAPVPGAFRAGAEVWTVEFDERRAGTLIKTEKFRPTADSKAGPLQDLPSRGRFWIDPFTGRVLMSELIAKNRDVTATVDVSYQSEPLVGLMVPVEMRESYHDRRGASIEGIAEYKQFRQFQVNVDEQFLLKKK